MDIEEAAKYVQVKNEQKYITILSPMWIAYMRELYKGDPEVENISEEELVNWLTGRLNIQGQRDTMHFEIIYKDNEVAGFAMYAVDLGGIKDILESGYGYIMELFILPAKRRKGIATEAFLHMEEVLKKQGADKLYLTPDSVSGIPFWKQVGFYDSGKVDPDNKMPIYIKTNEIINDKKRF